MAPQPQRQQRDPFGLRSRRHAIPTAGHGAAEAEPEPRAEAAGPPPPAADLGAMPTSPVAPASAEPEPEPPPVPEPEPDPAPTPPAPEPEPAAVPEAPAEAESTAPAEPPEPLPAEPPPSPPLGSSPGAETPQGAPVDGGSAGGGRWRPRVRSRWMWALTATIGVILLIWVTASLIGGGGSADPDPSPSANPFATQRTLLIQVRGDTDFASDNLIAGVGGDLPAAQVLVPSRLIVDVAGAGQQTLGQSARMIDRTASQDALSDLLALRVDGTLSLGRLALVGMVDFVGGIEVTVDEEVVETDRETDVETVIVPSGTGLLNGTQAAAYALMWLRDEPEAARLARYSTVMTETISSLPEDQLRVEQMLTSLGGSARTTAETAQVAAFLLEMRRGILAGGQQVRVLPTTDIESGESLPVVRVALAESDAVLRGLVPQALLSDAESRPRVLVQNGVGTPGLGASARDRLVGAGMVYINGGNAEQFGQEVTIVVVADESVEARAEGQAVAEALGVPDALIQVAQSGQNVADAVVVLGADFQP